MRQGVALKKSAKARQRYSFMQFVLRALWKLAILFVILSILLVLPIRWLAPPFSSLMVQRYLQTPNEPQNDVTIHYTWVSYQNISPHMALAVIAAEDQRFPLHTGFDFTEIKQALQDHARGKPLRGASTITQQVSKNLYLWPDQSLLRKGFEAWFTLLIELTWPKRRILEIYLNIAEMGEQVFGVEAASRRFFNKSANQLSREEAALLAAVLPNPLHYRVTKPSDHVWRRQNWILQQMRQLGDNPYLEKL